MMKMKEWQMFFLISGIFLLCYFFPLNLVPFKGPVFEALALVKWYAREHVLLCLVPAFFIAGAISVFLSKESVIKYLGPEADKFLSYGVASVSGSILAVCSCTVLPLFSGIYKRGAGLGPAATFLYSGPAINVLAIILTARVLGWQLGLARAVGAIVFSVVVGLLMHLVFLKEEKERPRAEGFQMVGTTDERPLWKNTLYFAAMVFILVFANWGKPGAGDTGLWPLIFQYKWWITGVFLVSLAYMILRWFKRDELSEWVSSSWGFAKQIMPLLFLGVLAAGILLGRPGHEGLIPSSAIENLVGGNSIFANFFASIVGAFMYFATLTEVPILEGLIGAGMGKGPALALLLAGPALSLPNMLVIRGVLGTKKTAVFVSLVVIMATITGIIYGALF
ncbi:MAG: permease [Candidatus Aminicenantes bacterium]|nr:permease [Candidatus Aminicenantes bacterium]NIM79740.1 permease [Candidatus Aminicenantes bacterium]NIN19071.1 permease [Candidatus Aminicenantes bacterium]NIN42973.1 permease [Candidatus Aminicenantes bacterium]NIN85716.1 permease [Candidatus Aminicenantes bacterium]